jgi:hypothetical protein
VRIRGRYVLVGVLLVGLVVGAGVFARSFRLACDGKLEVWTQLAQARSELDPTRPAPPPPPPAASLPQDTPPVAAAQPPPWDRAVRAVGHQAVLLVLWVKQSDLVAYPSHAMLARGLEVARCDRDAVRLQWIKAGVHAGQPAQAEEVAQVLRRSSESDAELARIRATVRGWAERESWSEGIRRVEGILSAES